MGHLHNFVDLITCNQLLLLVNGERGKRSASLFSSSLSCRKEHLLLVMVVWLLLQSDGYVHALFPARAMWLTLEMQAAQVSYAQDGPQIFHQKAHVETTPEM